MTVYAFTGHRPKDMPQGMTYEWFIKRMDMSGHAFNPSEDAFVVGGALGWDTWAAQYAIDNHIPFILITPFPHGVMTKMWRDADRERLISHIRASTQHIVIDQSGEYHADAYQKRNEAMIVRADRLIAGWSGKQYGGTWNAIRFARSMLHPIPITNLWEGGPRA